MLSALWRMRKLRSSEPLNSSGKLIMSSTPMTDCSSRIRDDSGCVDTRNDLCVYWDVCFTCYSHSRPGTYIRAIQQRDLDVVGANDLGHYRIHEAILVLFDPDNGSFLELCTCTVSLACQSPVIPRQPFPL